MSANGEENLCEQMMSVYFETKYSAAELDINDLRSKSFLKCFLSRKPIANIVKQDLAKLYKGHKKITIINLNINIKQ